MSEAEEEEEECFNMESSEQTRELEALFRLEAIGDTLYNKRWVIETVVGMARACEKEQEKPMDACSEVKVASESVTEVGEAPANVTSSEPAEEDSAKQPNEPSQVEADDEATERFASLVEMSANADVSAFLASSGCLDLFPLLLSCGRARPSELATCVLANACASSLSLRPMLLERPALLRAPLLALLRSQDVPELVAACKFVRVLCSGLAEMLGEDEEEEEEESQRVRRGRGKALINKNLDQG